MASIIDHNFLNRPSPVVAQELIGKFLIREHNDHQWALMITEVEAYDGPDDKASIAYGGRTEKNALMFAEAGVLHIHPTCDTGWKLAFITGPVDYPAAVVIRSALVLLPTGELEHIQSPETLAQFLKLDETFNAIQATEENKIWLEDRDITIPFEHVIKKPRINVDHAAEWKDVPYNFSVEIAQNKPATAE